MFTYNSARKLPTKVSYRRIAGMRRRPTLLPPYDIPIDDMKTKTSLDDVIADDSLTFSAVKVSLYEMGSQNNARPCQTNP